MENQNGVDCLDITGSTYYNIGIKDPNEQVIDQNEDKKGKIQFLIKILIVLMVVVLIEIYLYGMRYKRRRARKMAELLEQR